VRLAAHPKEHRVVCADEPEEAVKAVTLSQGNDDDDIVLGLRVYTNRKAPVLVQGQLRHGSLLPWKPK